MPEPLWKIRKRKGLSVNELATKSGVPAISIREYESGQAIRSADLPRLARALYVEEWDIEIKGKPLPRRAPPPDAAAPAPRPAPRPQKAPPPSPPARPSQIAHLVTMAAHHFGKDRAALEEEAGKPLETLTRAEVSKLLAHYQQLLVESREPGSPPVPKSKRRRAYLPEGVDEFELQYLTARQADETLLHFTLFDGQHLSGRIIGFSPYSITIREATTDDEVTIQKLAIAHYRGEPTGSAGGEP
jgi:transcriptional regulator with XRE-family HTH domain